MIVRFVVLQSTANSFVATSCCFLLLLAYNVTLRIIVHTMSFYQIFNYKKIPSIKRIDLPPERRVNRNLEGIIIGEIVAIKKHPNADIVRIARVAIKKNKYITIIFGGPRIEYIGARVAVALPGTPTDDGKL